MAAGGPSIGTQIVVGVAVTVLGTMVLAWLGLGDGGDRGSSGFSPPPPRVSNFCMTAGGSCLTPAQAVPGTPCTCLIPYVGLLPGQIQ